MLLGWSFKCTWSPISKCSYIAQIRRIFYLIKRLAALPLKRRLAHRWNAALQKGESKIDLNLSPVYTGDKIVGVGRLWRCCDKIGLRFNIHGQICHHISVIVGRLQRFCRLCILGLRLSVAEVGRQSRQCVPGFSTVLKFVCYKKLPDLNVRRRKLRGHSHIDTYENVALVTRRFSPLPKYD